MVMPGSKMAARRLDLLFIIDCRDEAGTAVLPVVNESVRRALPEIRQAAAKNPAIDLFVQAIATAGQTLWHVPRPTRIDALSWTDIAGSKRYGLGDALSAGSDWLGRIGHGARICSPVVILVSDGNSPGDISQGLRQLDSQTGLTNAVRISIGFGKEINRLDLAAFSGDRKTILHAKDGKDLEACIRIATTAYLSPTAEKAQNRYEAILTAGKGYLLSKNFKPGYTCKVSKYITPSDIREHLYFSETLLNRYKWPKDRRNKITAALDEIYRKNTDSSLYVGIIGEFSSGKSSMINAFLREDILTSNILPGTTSTTTLLKYGARHDLVVEFTDGKRASFVRDGPVIPVGGTYRVDGGIMRDKEGLIRYMRRVTAEEDIAKYVRTVTVYYPSDFLKTGLVIVDTPGINVSNPRHAEVTVTALRDICDAVIVTMPYDKPLSQTLERFLCENVRDILHRGIFVVTKTDNIDRDERGIYLDVTKERVRETLGLEKITMLTASPGIFLGYHDKKACQDTNQIMSPDEVKAFYEEFLDTERVIGTVLQEQRLLIQLENLTLLLSALLEQMAEDLRQVKSSGPVTGQYLANPTEIKVLVDSATRLKDIAEMEKRRDKLVKIRDALLKWG